MLALLGLLALSDGLRGPSDEVCLADSVAEGLSHSEPPSLPDCSPCLSLCLVHGPVDRGSVLFTAAWGNSDFSLLISFCNVYILILCLLPFDNCKKILDARLTGSSVATTLEGGLLVSWRLVLKYLPSSGHLSVSLSFPLSFLT